MPSPLFGITADVARIGMDALAMRQAVAAQNIAQAGVPGARTMRVSFAAQFDAAARTEERGGPWLQQIDQAVAGARVSVAPGAATLESQVLEANEVALHYRATAQSARHHFAMLSLAINTGRRG